MAESMEVMTLDEFREQFDGFVAEPLDRPVGVTHDGRVRFVLVDFEEYERLRRRDRIAGRTEDLDDETLEAIRTVEPEPRSKEAEAKLGSSQG